MPVSAHPTGSSSRAIRIKGGSADRPTRNLTARDLPFDSLFAFYLLVLLAVLEWGHHSREYNSSSGISCIGYFIGYFWVQPIAPPPCNPLHPPPPATASPGSCSA